MTPVPIDSSAAVTEWFNDLQDPAKREDAARKLWDQLHRYLLARIRNQIADSLEGKVSPDSVAQEVFQQIFAGGEQGEFKIKDRSGLLALLADMAAKKVIDKVRHHSAQKRKPGSPGRKAKGAAAAESSDQADRDSAPQMLSPREAGDYEGGRKVVSPEPMQRDYRVSHPKTPPPQDESALAGTPLQVLLQEADAQTRLVILEMVERLAPDLWAVFDLYVQSYTNAEIAAKLEIEKLAVKRKIKLIQETFVAAIGD